MVSSAIADLFVIFDIIYVPQSLCVHRYVFAF